MSSALKTAQMVSIKRNNCCFCGELRTGTLICSYLTLTRDAIVTVASLTFLCLSGSKLTWISGIRIAVFCIVIGIVFTNVIFTIVLIIGIHQFKNVHMKAYLIYNVVLMTIIVLLILMLCLASEPRILILAGLLFLMFHMYYLLIITSFYLKMDALSKKDTIYTTIEDPPNAC